MRYHIYIHNLHTSITILTINLGEIIEENKRLREIELCYQLNPTSKGKG